MRKTHIISAHAPPASLNVLGETVTVFAKEDGSKPFEVHIQEGKLGGGPPPHNHPWDEAFFILEGEVELSVDGSAEVLAAGSYVHIPAHTTHAYTNISATAKMLAVVSDCRGGEIFKAFDAHVHEMPQDLPKLLEIGRQFGVNFTTADESV